MHFLLIYSKVEVFEINGTEMV